MAKINHIAHKKSAVADKAPKATDISNGEIAVNYADDTERMYIKNASGKIIPFSADHIIIDSVLNTVLMDRTMGKGCDVSNPTLANVYGSKEALNMVLKHYKMGLFKDGALVKECAPCRITKAVDGSEIKIDGSEGDIMLYTDVPIYRDRCRVSGVTVPNSTATTHNMIGLGLMPHQIGWKDAKKMNPFAFTPGYVQLDREANEYRSCYNTSFSGNSSAPRYDYFTTNFILKNGSHGGYPVMNESAIDNMQRSRKKGPKYQGIFYEFYEMWLIAMYLELGSLNFTDIDSFGMGCGYYTPNASNWISGSLSGFRIKDGNGDGTDVYKYIGFYIEGLLSDNANCNFEEALESQRFVDALVKSNLVDKVDGKTVLEYDDDVNKKGYVKVSENVDLASGSGMKEGKKYYIIRNVPNCQGIGDGVMTYVLNVFVKTKFKDDFNYINYRGKDIIFKFSYPTYRGLELFSGAQTQIEGINYVVDSYKDGYGWKGRIWYAKDYTDIKYDPTNFKSSYDPTTKSYTDAEVPIDTPDENIPYIKGFVKAGEYDITDGYGNRGWVKNANYDVSLYCATESDRDYVWRNSYECGYVWPNSYASDGYKDVSASVVGCSAFSDEHGRTLDANSDVNARNSGFAGGFSIGNPSLQPTHGSDSGTTIEPER